MNTSAQESEYEAFVRRLERRPAGMSPLRYTATMELHPMASAWLIRWLEEQR